MNSLLRLVSVVILALAQPMIAAPVFETVTEFETPPRNPMGPLVLAGDGNYYGTSSDGGKSGFGTVFRVTPAGVRTTVVDFTGITGSRPGSAPVTGLTLAADGSLFGTTSSGGTDDFGTLFKVTTGGVFTPLVSFTGISGVAKGSAPSGEMLLHSDGNFYGTTSGGGASEFGTIFKLTPAGVLTTLAQFTGTGGSVRGANPVGRLATNASGVLFGVAQSGGASNFGTAFKITTTGTYTLLTQFTGTGGNTRGTAPIGPLVLGADSNFYGVTESGGLNDLGTFFRITQAGGHARLYDFDGLNGSFPGTGLMLGSDGLFYGSTASDGTSNAGLIFNITTAGSIGVITHLTGADGAAKGGECRGPLITGADGALYGTASTGGVGNNGTVFRIASFGVYSLLTEFTTNLGWSPSNGLSTGPDGALYLGNTEGGASGFGSIVKVTTAGAATPIVGFTGLAGSARGSEPAGVLTTGLDGSLYGVTRLGGALDTGTAFKIAANGAFTSITTFGSAIGSRPATGFIMDSIGNFYTTGSTGGLGGFGSVFGMTPSGSRGRLASFTGVSGTSPGSAPFGGLALGSDGSIYGTTSTGGASNLGTVFRVTSANLHVLLAEFNGTNGSTPTSGPALGPDGNLYGCTSAGGANGFGTLYQVTPAGVLTTLHDFSAITGSTPRGPLLVAPDGTIYGTTSSGGANGFGTIFRCTPAGVVSVLFDFTGATGASPGDLSQGALAFGPDGNLYGTATAGGSLNGGNVFRLRQLGAHAGTLGSIPLGTTSAQLFARIASGGESTSVTWEYGTTPALGYVVGGAPVSPSAPVTVALSLTNLAPHTTYYFRASATNPSGTSQGATLSFTTPTPLEFWKIQQLGSTTAADLDDPDHDSISNLIEYALNLSPVSTSTTPSPQMITDETGQHLMMSLDRDPSRNDVTIEVQASDTLSGSWTTIATSIAGAPFSGSAVIVGDDAFLGTRTVEIHDPATLADHPKRFLRLHIIH